MIVVDTSVLSRSLRRRPSERSDPVAEKLELVIRENVTVGIPGIVLQEVLSGVKSEEQFAALRGRLEAFSLLMADLTDHVEAARVVNHCRTEGITVAAIDALIAAMTMRLEGRLFTLDHDFDRIAQVVPLALFPL